MSHTRILAVSLAATALLSSAAWAGPGNTGTDPAAYGQPGDPKKVSRTVRIEASDFKYDITQLSFKSGETIKFVLVNKGQQDHQLTVADAAMQLKHRKMMQDMAAMPNMDMSKMPGHEHAMESMATAKAGETKEFVWQFTKSGSFEFACNFPGHADLGMTGTIAVQ